MARGRVLRFDHVKGYGFIAPDSGGEDVFLHANDLLTPDKHLLGPGAVVEFQSEHGERGAKASDVTIVEAASGAIPTQQQAVTPVETSKPSSSRADGEDEFVDVLPAADFQRDLTEILLTLDPALSGPQIVQVREQVVRQARTYGWVTG